MVKATVICGVRAALSWSIGAPGALFVCNGSVAMVPVIGLGVRDSVLSLGDGELVASKALAASVW